MTLRQRKQPLLDSIININCDNPDIFFIKVYTQDSRLGVWAIHSFLRYHATEIISRELIDTEINGKIVPCEIYAIKTKDGEQYKEEKIYFDISMFFDKNYDCEYLDKLKSSVIENKELYNLFLKYARNIEKFIDEFDNMNEAKDYLDTLKKVIDQIQNHEYKKKVVENYCSSLSDFTYTFLDPSKPEELKIKEEYIESLYTLWKENPSVLFVLHNYIYGLKSLKKNFPRWRDKWACARKIRKLERVSIELHELISSYKGTKDSLK